LIAELRVRRVVVLATLAPHHARSCVDGHPRDATSVQEPYRQSDDLPIHGHTLNTGMKRGTRSEILQGDQYCERMTDGGSIEFATSELPAMR
jgi:hypothetical protein